MALAALGEDTGSVPTTHKGQLTTSVTLIPRDLIPFSVLHRNFHAHGKHTYTQAHTQNKQINIQKIHVEVMVISVEKVLLSLVTTVILKDSPQNK